MIHSLLAALLCVSATAFAAPQITEVSAELEMKDFHDSTKIEGPIREGVPVTLTFKNHTIVKLVPIAIEDSTIRLKTQVQRSSGIVLYNATFFTRYNADVELSEKNEAGDLMYRLKLNPHTAQ